ncbi:hypothetical protein DFJ74DRAFT_57749 [Hyaloraphidium curvatum]|nr:hypothetical protein DFJ74DRAFT_57749 [Hyaloraphidium curvatum]
MPTPACGVVIRPAGPATYLHMREVVLVIGGAQIPRSAVSPSLSSVLVNLGVPLVAGFCTDGRLRNYLPASGELCHTNTGDPCPSFVASYDCALGALELVVVHNRLDDGYRHLINDFAADVVQGNLTVASYRFAGTDVRRFYLDVNAAGPSTTSATGTRSKTRSTSLLTSSTASSTLTTSSTTATATIDPDPDVKSVSSTATLSPTARPSTTYSNVCGTMPTPSCGVVIRPAAPPIAFGNYLHMREVTLVAGGVPLPLSAVSPALSSTFIFIGVPLAASYCNDGSLRNIPPTSGEICQTALGDACGTFVASYDCALGGIDTVVVHNRLDNGFADQLNLFSADVVRNGLTVASFKFAGSQVRRFYLDVTVPGPSTTATPTTSRTTSRSATTTASRTATTTNPDPDFPGITSTVTLAPTARPSTTFTNICGAMATPSCGIVFQPAAFPLQPPLTTDRTFNLREVQLFTAGGAQVPLVNVTPALSTVYNQGLPLAARFCNDGSLWNRIAPGGAWNNGPGQICATQELNDPCPAFTVAYDCTFGPLETVVLHNRLDCCWDRITSFKATVLDAGVAVASFRFPGTQVRRYHLDVTAPGASTTATSTTSRTTSRSATTTASRTSTTVDPDPDFPTITSTVTLAPTARPSTTFANICGAMATPSCGVVIQPAAVPLPAPLNTDPSFYSREVQLFAAGGAQIPTANITAAMSTVYNTYGVPLSASYCNDGSLWNRVAPGGLWNTGPGQICATRGTSDPCPAFTMSYDCAFGALSRVIVHNRLDCCRDNLPAYRAVVVQGGLAVASFRFNGTQVRRYYLDV